MLFYSLKSAGNAKDIDLKMQICFCVFTFTKKMLSCFMAVHFPRSTWNILEMKNVEVQISAILQFKKPADKAIRMLQPLKYEAIFLLQANWFYIWHVKRIYETWIVSLFILLRLKMSSLYHHPWTEVICFANVM